MRAFRRPSIPAGRRVYVVAGPQGDAALFDARLAAAREDRAARDPLPTRIVVAGDLIGSGADSATCVLTAMRAADDVDILAGRQERTMVEALEGSETAMAWWLPNGGDWVLASYGADRDVIAAGDAAACIAEARRVVPSSVHHWLLRRPAGGPMGDYRLTGGGLMLAGRIVAGAVIGLEANHRWAVN